MSITRRSLVAGGFSVAALATLAPKASAFEPDRRGRKTTWILIPHQDDALIRMSAYICYAADQGDEMRFLCATDGGATVVRKRLGLTYDQTVRYRNREQDHALAWLTDGKGAPVTRPMLPDGKATVRQVRAVLERELRAATYTPELYVATWLPDHKESVSADKHPDHRAVIQASLDVGKAHGLVVRAARHPATSKGKSGVTYTATDQQMHRITAACAAFKLIGQNSVPDSIQAVLDHRGRTVVTGPR